MKIQEIMQFLRRNEIMTGNIILGDDINDSDIELSNNYSLQVGNGYLFLVKEEGEVFTFSPENWTAKRVLFHIKSLKDSKILQ